MALSNIYKEWGEEEQAKKMSLTAQEAEPYFYKLGHYDEKLVRSPVDIFAYCNLGIKNQE